MVLDVTNAPIYSFDIILFKHGPKTNNEDNLRIEIPGYQGKQTFETDHEGMLAVNFSSFDSVEFKSLRPFTKKTPTYSLTDMEGKLLFLS